VWNEKEIYRGSSAKQNKGSGFNDRQSLENAGQVLNVCIFRMYLVLLAELGGKGDR